MSQVSELLEILGPSLSKRQSKWLILVHDGMKRLQQEYQSVTPEALLANEKFITVLLQASQAVYRTHQEEKHKALRNAVLNSALHVEMDDDLETMFVSFVDTLTPSHLRFLDYCDDPYAWIEGRIDMAERDWSIQWQKLLMPNYTAKKAFYLQVHRDLSQNGLISEDGLGPFYLQNGDIIPGKIDRSFSTEIGKQFLAFIRSPLSQTAS